MTLQQIQALRQTNAQLFNELVAEKVYGWKFESDGTFYFWKDAEGNPQTEVKQYSLDPDLDVRLLVNC